ncbi:hypothetical protein NB847_25545, partial [Pseudomonas aeruginosa]|nr:hypothetical protein [Pseudomonas aeruginosa]
MMKSIKKKHLLMASIAAAVVAIGGVTAILSSSGKKTALSYYDSFKERYYLQDVLSEGEISYSVFSGDLTGRPQKLSATPDHFGKVLPHVLSRTQRHRARHDPDRPV